MSELHDINCVFSYVIYAFVYLFVYLFNYLFIQLIDLNSARDKE